MIAAANKEQFADGGKTSSLGGVQISAPNAISNVMTAIPTKTRSISDGIHVSGREFVGTVEGNGVSTFGVGKSALIAPAYFYNGILGQLSRAYQYYKWRKLIVHYIPKVSTTTSGQVIICSSDNIDEPFFQPESVSLLSRAVVAGNGVMTPPWCPVRMMIVTDNVRRFVDPGVNVDINANIFCELQVYSQVSSSSQVGYLWLEYDCELLCPMLQPHLSELPFTSGPGLRVALQDLAAVNVIDSPLDLSEVSGTPVTSRPNGSIFRAVLDIQGSTAATGTTFANAWNVTQLYRATAGTIATSVTSIAMVGGLTLYLVVKNNDILVYASIEQAVSGITTGEVTHRTATTAAGTYVFDVAMVREGTAIIPTTQ